jgi:hypothetical protein
MLKAISYALVFKVVAAIFGYLTMVSLLGGSASARLYCLYTPAISILAIVFDRGRSELILRGGFTSVDRHRLHTQSWILSISVFLLIVFSWFLPLPQYPFAIVFAAILVSALSSCLYDWLNRKWVHESGNLNLLTLAQLSTGVATFSLSLIGNDFSILLLSFAPFPVAIVIEYFSRKTLSYPSAHHLHQRCRLDRVEAAISKALPSLAYFISLGASRLLVPGQFAADFVRFSFFTFGIFQLLLIQNTRFKPAYLLMLVSVIASSLLAAFSNHSPLSSSSGSFPFIASMLHPAYIMLSAFISILYYAALRFQYYFLTKNNA